VSAENPYLSVDQQMVGDVYTTTEVMDNLTVLCDDFGSRFGATEGERQAAEFIQAKFKEYGLSNVHTEPVPYTGWTRGEAKLEIISPIRKTIECISLPHAPAAHCEATLIDLSDGAPADFEKHADEIKGKVVMATSVILPEGTKRWIHRGEKYGRSVLGGAAGFIFVNHYPGYGPATGGIGHKGDNGLIPAISITKEDGAFIQRLIKRKGEVTIRMTTTDQSAPTNSWNVVADLPGNEHPNEIIMLGCHYDGHDISQGAGDPASGAVALMEAARVLAKYGGTLPRTIRFVLWGVEEIGLLGSTEYARAHANELSNIRFYLNMDAAGAVVNKGINLNEWPELAPIFQNWSEEMALPFDVGQSVHAFSDHFPFFMAGVPTGGLETVKRDMGGRGYGHTRYDTLDKVNLTSLREAAVLSARLALRLADTEDWPVSQRDTKIVHDLMDSPEYQEEATYRRTLSEHYAAVRSEK
jgi:Zn-dependent M28 family amino/carboxypeptidase